MSSLLPHFVLNCVLAFVYELDSNLGWSLNAQLQPGLDNGANFGHSVSVHGDVVVVGADGIGELNENFIEFYTDLPT